MSDRQSNVISQSLAPLHLSLDKANDPAQLSLSPIILIRVEEVVHWQRTTKGLDHPTFAHRPREDDEAIGGLAHVIEHVTNGFQAEENHAPAI